MRHPLIFMTETTTTSNSIMKKTAVESAPPKIIDRSTFLLLEHVNLNIPQQEPSLSTYVELLGLGLDPRRAPNVGKSGTIWTNCGPCQFHLPHGPVGQRIPGHIGLRYDSLENLKQRVSAWQQPPQQRQQQQEQPHEDVQETNILTEMGQDPKTNREYVKVTDAYGNIFYCRVGRRPLTFQTTLRQPLVTNQDTAEFGELVASKYGVSSVAKDSTTELPSSDCRGIEYVEFPCPYGTAERIALFYDSVFDATTSVIQEAGKLTQVAVIAFGDIDENGQAEQSLIFREVSPGTALLPYDGHHIALYVGETAQDFEKAFENCKLINLVWVNPRFKDNATDLAGARYWKQFRFKEIVDLNTGEPLLELEHEVRCVEHEAWPGPLPTPWTEAADAVVS